MYGMQNAFLPTQRQTRPKASIGGAAGSVYSSGSTEARSGIGHFNSTGGTTYQVPGVSGSSGPPAAGLTYGPAGSATGQPGSTGGNVIAARSGIGHFNTGGGTPTQTPGVAVAGGPPGAPPDAGPTPAAPNPYGSQSGPGILENWFNQRASGADPGYEYAMNRGMNDIDSRMAAGGSYNSGARGQQLSDFASNMAAQREAQLDALAGGASGEHLGRLGLMFGQGQALAGGQAGLASAYDLGAAGNMAAANQAQTQMNLNSAAQQQQAHQGFANNLMQMYGLSKMGNSGGGGGGYDYAAV